MRDAYFFIMAQKNDNSNSKQDNFYALVKELLETQTATLKAVKDLSDKIDRLPAKKGDSSEKDLAKLWEGI